MYIGFTIMAILFYQSCRLVMQTQFLQELYTCKKNFFYTCKNNDICDHTFRR